MSLLHKTGHTYFLVAILLFSSHVNAKCKPWKKSALDDAADGYVCFGGSIAEIDRIPANITKIAIHGMTIGRITKALFGRFSGNLERLDCMKSSITDIEDNAFSEMTKLKSLFLNFNNLTKVKAAWFKNTVSMEDIVLNKNEIDEIDEDGFSKLTALTEISLEGNNLRTLKAKCIPNTVYLEMVNLTYNKTDDIEKCEKNIR